jgi:sugar/nucleoside kinase (ribokinase family)
MEKKVDCTVIGDAMIDIVLPLSEELDLQGGITNTKARISLGGIANVASCISKLGGKSSFIGKIGDDYWGRTFIKGLDKNKVIKNVFVSKMKPTGIVFVLLIPNKERIFIVDRGANAELSYDEIDLDLILNSDYLYFAGFSFQDEKAGKAIQKAAKEASESNVTIIFNPGAPALAKSFRDSFHDIMKKYVDLLILNHVEGQYLTGIAEEESLIRYLLDLVDKVVLTKGDKGSIVATKNNIYNIKAYPTRTVDTTGAGDAYGAAFIYGLSRGWMEDKCGEFASKIAAKIVSQKGAEMR